MDTLGKRSAATTGSPSAAGIATYNLLCDFGCGVGPFFPGFVLSAFGYVGMHLVSSVVALGAVAYYHVSHGCAAGKGVA